MVLLFLCVMISNMFCILWLEERWTERSKRKCSCTRHEGEIRCTQIFFAKRACMCSVVKCFLNIYECERECGCVCVIWLESALALALKRWKTNCVFLSSSSASSFRHLKHINDKLRLFYVYFFCEISVRFFVCARKTRSSSNMDRMHTLHLE